MNASKCMIRIDLYIETHAQCNPFVLFFRRDLVSTWNSSCSSWSERGGSRSSHEFYRQWWKFTPLVLVFGHKISCQNITGGASSTSSETSQVCRKWNTIVETKEELWYHAAIKWGWQTARFDGESWKDCCTAMYDPTLPEPLPTFPAFPVKIFIHEPDHDRSKCWSVDCAGAIGRNWTKNGREMWNWSESDQKRVELLWICPVLQLQVEWDVLKEPLCFETEAQIRYQMVLLEELDPVRCRVHRVKTTHQLHPSNRRLLLYRVLEEVEAIHLQALLDSAMDVTILWVSICQPIKFHIESLKSIEPSDLILLATMLVCTVWLWSFTTIWSHVDMRRAVFGIARIAPGELRSQERNLLSSSHNLYISHLLNRPPMELNKRNFSDPIDLTNINSITFHHMTWHHMTSLMPIGEIVRACMEFLRIINEKILPRTFFHTLVVWLKLYFSTFNLKILIRS